MKQGAALLDGIGSSISPFGFVTDDVRKRGFNGFPVMVSRIGSPILERRAKAVRCDIVSVHSLEKRREDHIGPRLSSAGQKHEFAFAALDSREDFNAPISKRNTVRPASLHAFGWDGPKAIGEVDIFPAHVSDLTGSGNRENNQFQRTRRKRFPRPESGDKIGSIIVCQSRVVAAYERPRPREHHLKMAAPSRRVLSCSMAGYAGRIKHALNAGSNTLRCFRVIMPDRAERIEHGGGIDRINTGRPDAGSMRFERVSPLPPVDFAFPTRGVIGHEPFRDFGKWWGKFWGILDGKRVNAIRNEAASLCGLLSRIGKRDGIRSAKAHFAALAGESVEENPPPSARFVNREIQSAAVCMPSWGEIPGNFASGKPVYLPCHPTKYPTACAGLSRRAAKAGDICKRYIPGIMKRKRTATNENAP